MQLSVLTWNVSCLEPSAAAPRSWTSTDQKKGVVDVLLESQADLISLQELQTPLRDERFNRMYAGFGFAASHCGHVQLFVRKGSGIDLVEFIEDGPAIVAVMLKDGAQLFFAGCHLAPFKDNKLHRQQQMLSVSSLMPKEASVVIAGDMNMREDETTSALSAFHCEDAFISAGAPSKHKFTWDSRKNKYHENGFEFTCRFDRVFVRNWDVVDFQLVGDKPASDNSAHFLSDHFGVYVKLQEVCNVSD